MNKILENIEAIRKERGIRQEYVAEALGVSQQTYSGYFTVSGDMKISRIQEIANILGVSLVDIVTYPVKYAPVEGEAFCRDCQRKDEVIENLNLLLRQLKTNK